VNGFWVGLWMDFWMENLCWQHGFLDGLISVFTCSFWRKTVREFLDGFFNGFFADPMQT
jgi:hypothetical protein